MPRAFLRCVANLRDFLAEEGVPADAARSLVHRLSNSVLAVEGLTEQVAGDAQEEFGRLGGRGVILHPSRPEQPDGCLLLLCGPPAALIPVLRRLVQSGMVEGPPGFPPVGAESLPEAVPSGSPPPLEYRGKKLDFSSGPLVMGVLNVTPDSFYDGGRFLSAEKAKEKAFTLLEDGSDILDIGGASTRPGSEPVPAQVELERVLPVLTAVRAVWHGWISVDTQSALVAHAVLGEGGDMVNDISAGRNDPDMKKVIKDFGAPCILMHMQGTPRTMQQNPTYGALISEMLAFFRERLMEWEQAGVPRDRLLLDPGIGFGKTLRHNLSLLRNLREFCIFGRPIVLGTSRKSFIGTVLKRGVQERLAGTLATLVMGALAGAHVFRVHDVPEARDALAMVHALQQE